MSLETEIFKHPIVYTIFKPTVLIGATAGKNSWTVIESRVLTWVLDRNHKKEAETFFYRIPYKEFLPKSSMKWGNQKADVKRIEESLQRRSFYLDTDFMRANFGEKAPASFAPFPTVRYHENEIEVEIHRYLKLILRHLYNGGFTKGDRETIDNFKNEAAFPFYWEIRKRQPFMKFWEIELEELKKLLCVEGKYNEYKNFRRKVLQICREEFKNTWVAFDFEELTKGKGKVHAIRFTFTKGPRDEEDLPAGTGFSWEKNLLAYKVNEFEIKRLRNMVKAEMPTTSGFVMDSLYIELSIEFFRADLQRKVENKALSQIKSPAAYLFSGLMSGRWIQEVVRKKEQIAPTIEDFESPPHKEDNQEYPPAFANFKTKKEDIYYSEEIVEEWKQLWKESKQNDSFNEFMIKTGHVQEDGKWRKI